MKQFTDDGAAGAGLDAVRLQYLFEGMDKIHSDTRALSAAAASVATAHNNTPDPSAAGASGGEGSATVNASHASLISTVKDLFPELGQAFVLRCLEYYDNSPERVINSLLEDNLPPHLMEMDRSEELMPNTKPEDTDVNPKGKDIEYQNFEMKS